METYYKNIDGGYITAIGTGIGDEEITREEYENILSIIRSRPDAEPGFVYRLRTDLTWEMAEAESAPEEEEIGAEEALDIILGGEGV